MMSKDTHAEEHLQAGAWPFVTLRRETRDGRRLLWRARDHRKGLFRHRRALEHVRAPAWQTARYNWIMGLVFVIGASLFMAGSAMALYPKLVSGLPGWTTNVTFFIGSIPFTTAAYLQLFQAANADQTAAGSGVRPQLFGWSPESPGWLSAATQFVGTVAFNFNTFDAINAPKGWVAQNLAIWTPGMIGSVLFLVSAYLAYIEVGHAHFSKPRRELGWWIAAINLVGCIAFMIASTLAYVPRHGVSVGLMDVSNANLWFGAFCFALAAALSMREARHAGDNAAA
ncbi:hypothetical protein JET14_06195 [Martelella lutilitoris]|uniref:YrhK domain-containing protein n=2 Tax=Martelella lutilitoris TaxID=2583532 RepID=A0A7T7HMC5_9HYPH|nr:hypothetical protein JET14_06195 [Martelella lutilitoris]